MTLLLAQVLKLGDGVSGQESRAIDAPGAPQFSLGRGPEKRDLGGGMFLTSSAIYQSTSCTSASTPVATTLLMPLP